MAGARVFLEFDDGKKYWNLIDPVLGDTIQDVINNIELKFSVKCENLLFEDAFLHPKESINIFRDKDLIRVVRKSEQRSLNAEVSVEQLAESQIEEEKCSDYETTIKTKRKRKKRRDIENAHHIEESQETPIATTETILPLIDDDSICTKPKKKKKVELEKSENRSEEDVSTLELNEQKLTTCEALSEEVKSVKRKRRRRRSHHKNAAEPVDIPRTIEYLSPPKAKERKHIHFGDQELNDTALVKSEPEQTCLFNPIPDKIVNGFKSTPTAQTNSWSSATNPTPNVPAQFNALLALRHKPTVFARSYDEKIDNPTVDPVPEPTPELTPEPVTVKENNTCLPEFIPTKHPLCIGPPRMGDVIAYKVLELSETYCPEVSEYRQGRITDVKSCGEVTIEIIGEPISRRNYGGKFELIEVDEEEPEEEFETVATHNWNELIEPRLIFP